MKELVLNIENHEHRGLISMSDNKPLGFVVFVHGLGEHCGRYTELFKLFNSAGYHCIGIDHYGHGRSEGKRGHVPSYTHFLSEIKEAISYGRTSFQELPVILYGHSLGGNIVLNYLLENSATAAIVTSPWLKLTNPVSGLAKAASSIMLRIYPSLAIPNGIDPEGISSDEEEVRRYTKDPLIHDRISVRLFHEAATSANRILAEAGQITTPTLLMHGTADPITSHLGSGICAENNTDYIDFRLFPGMRHELHHEKDRQAVFKTVQTWIEKIEDKS